jgi:hypothetical protein
LASALASRAGRADDAAPRGPFFRATDYTPADQAHLSAAMVDQLAMLADPRRRLGPNYGSGPTFAIVEPVTHPWAVVTYLQSLVGAGAERRPNLRLTLDAPEPVSLRALFTALCDGEGLSAAIVIGIIRSAYLSARDWIKPAVYGERYGLKMDEYRTRITIANPTWQMIVAYLERPVSGGLAILLMSARSGASNPSGSLPTTRPSRRSSSPAPSA